MSPTCAVFGCQMTKGVNLTERESGLPLHFFRFPIGTDRLNVWIDACGRNDLNAANIKERVVCSLHFRSGDIIGNRFVRPSLSKTAAPVLSLPSERSTFVNLPISFSNSIVECDNSKKIMKIRSNLQNMDDINRWVKEYEQMSNTKWNTRRSRPQGEKIVASKQLVCNRSSFGKLAAKLCRKDSSKNCVCRATISVTIRKDNSETREIDPYFQKERPAFITIVNDHNHSLVTSEIVQSQPSDGNTRHQFFSYFNNGLGIAQACKYHEGILEFQKEDSEEANFNRRKNPSEDTVRSWHNLWTQLHIHSLPKDGLIEKLIEKRENLQRTGVTVEYRENPLAILIMTPIMKRAHQLSSSEDIIFADTVGPCDNENHFLTFFLTPSAAGDIPLGVVITEGESLESYMAGFSLIKSVVPDCFNGKSYPGFILTNHLSYSIIALQNVWRESTVLMCAFHICKAVWEWLRQPGRGIRKEDHLCLFRQFQKVLHSPTVARAEEACQELLASHTCKMYPAWEHYFADLWNTRELWCLAWRFTVHEYHSNMVSDITIRLFKDIILSRVDVHNLLSLVDMCSQELEKYYCCHLQDFCRSGIASSKKLQSCMLKKTAYISSATEIEQVKEHEFRVPSENYDEFYLVNVNSVCCTCPLGQFGRLCKHQCAVYKFFKITLPAVPKVNLENLQAITFLTFGDYSSRIELSSACIEGKNNKEFQGDLSKLYPSDIQSTEIVADPFQAADFGEVIDLLQKCNNRFGSPSESVVKMVDKMNRIQTKQQWEDFLDAAGDTVLDQNNSSSVGSTEVQIRGNKHPLCEETGNSEYSYKKIKEEEEEEEMQ